VSGTEGPIAPWAFRAALSGLPDGEVRDILESDRCPQPEADQDTTVLDESDGGVVIRRPDADATYLRSDRAVSLEAIR
jgi:hypothetical protein